MFLLFVFVWVLFYTGDSKNRFISYWAEKTRLPFQRIFIELDASEEILKITLIFFQVDPSDSQQLTEYFKK